MRVTNKNNRIQIKFILEDIETDASEYEKFRAIHAYYLENTSTRRTQKGCEFFYSLPNDFIDDVALINNAEQFQPVVW